MTLIDVPVRLNKLLQGIAAVDHQRNVTTFQAGDHVFGMNGFGAGTYAEKVGRGSGRAQW